MNIKRRKLIKAGLMGIVLGFGGCVSSNNRTVEMTYENRFNPNKLSISKGVTVIWKNTSSVDHTVTAYEDEIPEKSKYFASGNFESEIKARRYLTEGLIPPGGEYKHTFEHAGIYRYFCIPHESSGMKATIEVR